MVHDKDTLSVEGNEKPLHKSHFPSKALESSLWFLPSSASSKLHIALSLFIPDKKIKYSRHKMLFKCSISLLNKDKLEEIPFQLTGAGVDVTFLGALVVVIFVIFADVVCASVVVGPVVGPGVAHCSNGTGITEMKFVVEMSYSQSVTCLIIS